MNNNASKSVSRLLGTFIFTLLMVGVSAQSSAATSLTAWTITALKVREAPASHAAFYFTIPKYTKIKLYGCKVDNYGNATWCKTSMGYNWGWVSAKYITVRRPVIKSIKIIPAKKSQYIYRYQKYRY